MKKIIKLKIQKNLIITVEIIHFQNSFIVEKKINKLMNLSIFFSDFFLRKNSEINLLK